MKREELKAKGLTDEQIEFVMAENGRDVEAQKTKTTATETERDGLKTQLGEANKQIDAFKEMKPDDLKKAADDYKTKFEEAQKEAKNQVDQLRFDHALDSALVTAKAKNAKAVRALLNTELLKLAEDGSVSGLNDQLEKLKKDSGYLFDADGKQTPPPTIVTPGKVLENQPTGTFAEAIAEKLNMPKKE